MGSASLWAGARKSFATKRLRADDGPDLVAVDVKITDARVFGHVIRDRADAAVQPQRQPHIHWH